MFIKIEENYLKKNKKDNLEWGKGKRILRMHIYIEKSEKFVWNFVQFFKIKKKQNDQVFQK